jgi:hypothetical protein
VVFRLAKTCLALLGVLEGYARPANWIYISDVLPDPYILPEPKFSAENPKPVGAGNTGQSTGPSLSDPYIPPEPTSTNAKDLTAKMIQPPFNIISTIMHQGCKAHCSSDHQ